MNLNSIALHSEPFRLPGSGKAAGGVWFLILRQYQALRPNARTPYPPQRKVRVMQILKSIERQALLLNTHPIFSEQLGCYEEAQRTLLTTTSIAIDRESLFDSRAACPVAQFHGDHHGQ